jgi:hypothetical protein
MRRAVQCRLFNALGSEQRLCPRLSVFSTMFKCLSTLSL